MCRRLATGKLVARSLARKCDYVNNGRLVVALIVVVGVVVAAIAVATADAALLPSHLTTVKAATTSYPMTGNRSAVRGVAKDFLDAVSVAQLT